MPVAESPARNGRARGRKAVTVTAGITAGVMTFYSFVLTPVIFAKIPNPGRGEMLAAIFPAYFLVALVLTALVFGAAVWWRPASHLPAVSSAAALLLSAVNQFYTGPLLFRLGEQIRAQNVTDPASPLKHDFGMWHGVSQGANLAVVIAVWFVLIVSLREPRTAPEPPAA